MHSGCLVTKSGLEPCPCSPWAFCPVSMSPILPSPAWTVPLTVPGSRCQPRRQCGSWPRRRCWVLSPAVLRADCRPLPVTSSIDEGAGSPLGLHVGATGAPSGKVGGGTRLLGTGGPARPRSKEPSHRGCAEGEPRVWVVQILYLKKPGCL